MTPNQIETVNIMNQMILIPLNIIPVHTKRKSTRLYYKDTVTGTRYAVKVEKSNFNVRPELTSWITGEPYRFGSRTLFRTIDTDKQLEAALSDFKDYVIKYRR